MRAITIIKKLRYRYAQKYKHSINENLLHYSNWLQDEYAELVMKQANGAESESGKLPVPNVGSSLPTFEDFNKITDLRHYLLRHPNSEMITASCLHYLGDDAQKWWHEINKPITNE